MYGKVLIHHGIKKQKWGKRNGPPYPLAVNQHSTAEQRSNDFSNMDSVMDKTESSSDEKKKDSYSNSESTPKNGSSNNQTNKSVDLSVLKAARTLAEAADKYKLGNIYDGPINKKIGEAKKEEMSHMTNEELAAVIRRVNLEKQYADLTSNKSHKGEDFVKHASTILGLALTAANLYVVLSGRKNK